MFYVWFSNSTGLSLTHHHIFLSYLNTDPIYFWQQTAEDITVCVRMPEGVTKEEVQFRLTADNICIGVQGFPPLLEGQLYASVDTEASAWIIKNVKRFASWNVQSCCLYLQPGFSCMFTFIHSHISKPSHILYIACTRWISEERFIHHSRDLRDLTHINGLDFKSD